MKNIKKYKKIIMGISILCVVFYVIGCTQIEKENVCKNENVETETTIDKEKRIKEIEESITLFEQKVKKQWDKGYNIYLEDYYNYPDVTGLDEEDAIRLCKIPSIVIDSMRMEHLAQAIIDYPFFDKISALSENERTEFINNNFDAYNELIKEGYCKYYLMKRVVEYSEEAKGLAGYEEKMSAIKSFIISEKYIEEQLDTYDRVFLTNSTVEEVDFSAKSREIGWFEDVDEFSMRKITSIDELEAFRLEYEDDFIYAYETVKEESMFYSILKGYNEQYFKNNTLFVTYYITGVNGNSHFAGKTYLVDGNHLLMEINSENSGGLGNCAMSGHLVIIGVSNDIVKECTRFSSYYYDIYEDNYLKRKE